MLIQYEQHRAILLRAGDTDSLSSLHHQQDNWLIWQREKVSHWFINCVPIHMYVYMYCLRGGSIILYTCTPTHEIQMHCTSTCINSGIFPNASSNTLSGWCCCFCLCAPSIHTLTSFLRVHTGWTSYTLHHTYTPSLKWET